MHFAVESAGQKIIEYVEKNTLYTFDKDGKPVIKSEMLDALGKNEITDKQVDARVDELKKRIDSGDLKAFYMLERDNPNGENQNEFSEHAVKLTDSRVNTGNQEKMLIAMAQTSLAIETIAKLTNPENSAGKFSFDTSGIYVGRIQPRSA